MLLTITGVHLTAVDDYFIDEPSQTRYPADFETDGTHLPDNPNAQYGDPPYMRNDTYVYLNNTVTITQNSGTLVPIGHPGAD